MGIHNLSQFIKVLEAENEILHVKKEISPILEMSEVVDRLCKERGKAVIFDNPVGSDIPVAMNLFGSDQRMALSLGINDIEDLATEIQDIITIKPPKGLVEGIKLFPKYGKLFSYHTKTVKKAPCQEIVEDKVDLSKIPVLQCWPKDAGPFITLPIVITKDPETQRLNGGMYRLQVFDESSTGMHWHKHHDGAVHYRKYKRLGKRMEIAVVLGGPPSLIFSATAPLPPFVDEFTFACFLMKDSIKMIQCKTVDLQVPAEAEIVLEGYVDPDEDFRLEGPFGDHTGYYSMEDYFPVFHVTAITRRSQAIYPSIIVGKPPMEDTYMGKVTERIFLPMLRMLIPEIVDMSFPSFGVFHNFVFVSIKKDYPYHAKKVMSALWGLGQMMLTKFIVIVDEDVDVQNVEEVMWKFGNNVDPRRDTLMVDGPLDQLDHSSPYSLGGAKMGFDATTRWKDEGAMRDYPPEMIMSESVKSKIDGMWATLFE